MKEWQKISCVLCFFGFLRELRPSESYVTEYLIGEWRNITSDQVNRDVYPIGTYSYLAQLVIVFLITDFLRYKPIIVICGISGIIVWSMLIWTTSLLALQILEIFYGTYMASEVAYYTYIYAKVDKKYYSKVTSHTRAAVLTGKMIAGISSQLLVNFHLMNYKELNYITLSAQIFSTFWALALPKVTTSLYFHRQSDNTAIQTTTIVNNNTKDDDQISAGHLLWSHFKNAYTNTKVLQWSIWYSMGLCGQLQVVSYIQVLWKTIEPNPEIAWNGAVEAILTSIGAIFALIAGYIHAEKLTSRSSLLLLAFFSIFEGIFIFLSCWTSNIFVSYFTYIGFGALFSFTITVASAEVARCLEEESYGLVFGINTLLGLLLQTLLTLIFVSENGFHLSVIEQYFVYSSYFVSIGVVYLFCLALDCIRTKKTFEVTRL